MRYADHDLMGRDAQGLVCDHPFACISALSVCQSRSWAKRSVCMHISTVSVPVKELGQALCSKQLCSTERSHRAARVMSEGELQGHLGRVCHHNGRPTPYSTLTTQCTLAHWSRQRRAAFLSDSSTFDPLP